jgi:two-component system phosphate regulon sensor histidine kinase PhoR
VKLGVRFKLFFVLIGIVALSFAVADAVLTRAIEKEKTDAIRDDLFVRAALVADQASRENAPLDDHASWDAFADRLGATSGSRVTLVAPDGTVLGDSDVSTDALAKLDNHAARPEIHDALSTGRGASARRSATLDEKMMYVAIPFGRGENAHAIVRLATPLRAVDDAIGRLRELIWFASFAALALAAIASSVAAQATTREIRSLTEIARKMADGDLEVRSRADGSDEVGELARALDGLASSLSTTLHDLRDERDQQRAILDGMSEGVLVLDKEGRIVMMNSALRAMLLVGSDVKGRLLVEAVRHAELHDFAKKARELRGNMTKELDLPGLQPRRLLVQTTPIADEAQELLAVFVDVTDLRRLENLRRDFVANVSHELRTPVTAVRSAAETLRTAMTEDPSRAGRFVDIIDRNAQRLHELIEDLLELSRLESNQFQLKKETVDVLDTANLVASLFRERAEKKKVKLLVRPGEKVALRTDQRALEQVLTNLVDNAIKYCPAGSTIAINASEKEETTFVRVEDDGPGIDPKHLPRLFERFYRVDAGRSRDVGGTGLGLSIVKHLAEAMGGEVDVESAVGRGSKFTLTLPRQIHT